MTKRYKAPKITARWNKDLTVSLYARGKLVYKCTNTFNPKECAEAWMNGWFSGEAHNVRWIYA